jgi:uncharacterized glyoxalase superfamily protein PhnB
MKETPKNWTRISSALFYEDPAAAIDWLCRAFGFEVRIRVDGEDGSVVHSELVFGEGLIMVGGLRAEQPRASPRSIGGANTQSLQIYVDDVPAHCARARAAGARIFQEPKVSDYGEEYWADMAYGAEDPEGHRFWFAQRLRDPG